jgi:hypothetical protein
MDYGKRVERILFLIRYLSDSVEEGCMDEEQALDFLERKAWDEIEELMAKCDAMAEAQAEQGLEEEFEVKKEINLS